VRRTGPPWTGQRCEWFAHWSLGMGPAPRAEAHRKRGKSERSSWDFSLRVVWGGGVPEIRRRWRVVAVVSFSRGQPSWNWEKQGGVRQNVTGSSGKVGASLYRVGEVGGGRSRAEKQQPVRWVFKPIGFSIWMRGEETGQCRLDAGKEMRWQQCFVCRRWTEGGARRGGGQLLRLVEDDGQLGQVGQVG
jgi:hypothetical protein